MINKKKLSAIVLGLALLAPSVGQACQWVRVGELGERLECRSNYRNFFKENTLVFNKLLTEAAFMGLGEAEKLTIDNWAIRNAVTLPEAQDLLKGRFEATETLNQMNSLIRQQEALDGSGEFLQLPSAIMLGVTIPVNGDMTKIPGIKKVIPFIPHPGGSLFVGLAVIPQKVEFIINVDGQLLGPEEYVSEKASTEEAPDSFNFSGMLGSILAPANPESFLYDYYRARIDYRLIVIPSLDAKLGINGKFKNTYVKPTIGMVFGRNLVSTHQLLNSGPSISVPGKNIRMIRDLSILGPFVMPNWLATPIANYVDTIKIGYSYSGQDEFSKPEDDNIQQFNENAFVWLRFGDRLKNLRRPETTVEDVVEGKFRWGWFWNVGVMDDGESDHWRNGLSGDDIASTITSSIGDTIKNILGQSEKDLEGADPASIEDKIENLEDSLAADDAARTEDKLAPEVRSLIEQEIQKLEVELRILEAAREIEAEKN